MPSPTTKPAGDVNEYQEVPNAIDAPPSSDASDRERIATRAYELFQARGGEPGREEEDWFEAERQIKQDR